MQTLKYTGLVIWIAVGLLTRWNAVNLRRLAQQVAATNRARLYREAPEPDYIVVDGQLVPNPAKVARKLTPKPMPTAPRF
jgi:hypothetical protein